MKLLGLTDDVRRRLAIYHSGVVEMASRLGAWLTTGNHTEATEATDARKYEDSDTDTGVTNVVDSADAGSICSREPAQRYRASL